MRRTRCDCGKWIVWGLDPEGQRIPLDPAAPCYRVLEEGQEGDLAVAVQRDRGALVNHFATCKLANRFSGGSRRAAHARGA